MYSLKPIQFLGSSLDDLRALPVPARAAAGFALDRVQRGVPPPDWKPLPSLGPGVMEIRIHSWGAWRLVYLQDHGGHVVVLHVFRKGKQTIERRHRRIIAKRLKELQ